MNKKNIIVVILLVLFILLCCVIFSVQDNVKVAGNSSSVSLRTTDRSYYWSDKFSIRIDIFFKEPDLYNKSVKLSYHIYDEKGRIIQYENERVSFELSQSKAYVDVNINLRELRKNTKLDKCFIRFDLVDEQNIYWFSDNVAIDFETVEIKYDNNIFKLFKVFCIITIFGVGISIWKKQRKRITSVEKLQYENVYNFINKVFCICFVTISSVFFACYLFHIDDNKALSGVNSTIEKPQTSIKSVMSGEYQNKFNSWFADNFPYRNTMTILYNQIKYNCFNELNGVWIAGKDGYLFNGDQSKSYCLGDNNYTDEQYEQYAKKVAFVQQELIKRGKKIIYILTPVKAQIYPEKLPQRYQVALKVNEDYTETNYNKLKKVFDKYNVIYYDTIEDLLEIKKGKYPVFYKTAHHWSTYSSALELNNIFDYMNNLYKINLPKINIDEMVAGNINVSDQDILSLANLIKCDEDNEYHKPLISYDQISEDNLFIWGTSFIGSIYEALTSQGQSAFSNITAYSRFTLKIINDENGTNTINYDPGVILSNNDMLRDIDNSDIMMIVEDSIFGVDDIFVQFFDYIESSLIQRKYDVINLKGDSWTEMSEDGRWSTGNSCTISLPQNIVKESCVNLQLSSNTNYNVSVSANDIYIDTIVVTTEPTNYKINIPTKVLKEADPIELEFEIKDNVYSTTVSKESVDIEKRGICITELSFE